MKKITLLFCCMAALNVASAQYGQRIYFAPGSKLQETFNDGKYSTINLSGGFPTYVATGEVDSSGMNKRSRFIRQSNTGANVANRQYKVFGGGFECYNYSNSIAESANRCLMTGGVFGNPGYTIAGGRDILILRSNGNGTLASANHVDLNGGFEEGNCIIPSAFATNRFYACGTRRQGGPVQAVVMKMANTGATVNWVRYYGVVATSGVIGDTYANSIVEEPGTGSVFVVGYTIDNTSTTPVESAFISKFLQNGTHVYTFTYSDGSLATGGLRYESIKPIPGSPGNYVIAGNYVARNTAGGFINDPYLQTVNLAGGVPVIGISQIYGMTTTAGTIEDAFATDVTTRLNFNTGLREYFISGAITPMFQSSQAFILKVDQTGGLMGTQIYGGTASDGFNAIDAVGNGSAVADGLTAFGYYSQFTGTSPGQKGYWVKPYYNLISGCNESTAITFLLAPTLITAPYTPVIASAFTITPVSFSQSNCSRAALCWNTTISAGSNLKVDDSQLTDNDLLIYPNPAQANDLITLKFESQAEENAVISIYDAKGVQVQTSNELLTEGENEIQLTTGELSKGLYLLRINSASRTTQKSFIIK